MCACILYNVQQWVMYCIIIIMYMSEQKVGCRLTEKKKYQGTTTIFYPRPFFTLKKKIKKNFEICNTFKKKE